MNYNRGCYNQPRGFGYNVGKSCMDNCKNPFNSNKKQLNYDTNYTNLNNETNSTQEKDMNYKLAMVYPAYQEWQNIYSGDKAITVGTIFAELDKPFYGAKGNCKCNLGNNGGMCL